MADSRRTNSLAAASLVCGLIPLLPATLAAIILGIVARRQINRTGERGAALATTGLALGGLQIVLGGLQIVLLALRRPDGADPVWHRPGTGAARPRTGDRSPTDQESRLR